MKRLIAVGVAASALCGLSAVGAVVPVRADTLPGGTEGCVASSPGAEVSNPALGGVAHNGSCSYRATRIGGYVAAGDSWSIAVSRVVEGVPKTVAVYRGARNAGPDKLCHTSVIQPDDVVTVRVTNGVVFVGDPRTAAVANGSSQIQVGVSQRDTACPA